MSPCLFRLTLSVFQLQRDMGLTQKRLNTGMEKVEMKRQEVTRSKEAGIFVAFSIFFLPGSISI
jgi:hypothetical protein